jgi:KUP system potassium uptake protein
LAVRWRNALPLEAFLKTLKSGHPPRIAGTAIFMVPNDRIVPTALLHNLKHNHVLHERIVLMKVVTKDIPHVPDDQRLAITHLDHNFHLIEVGYGFMDEPNIPRALAQLRLLRFHFNLLETSFFVGREKVVLKAGAGIWTWRKRVFLFIHRTMMNATDYFHIPTNRVVTLGGQVEL